MRSNTLLFRNDLMMDRIKDARNLNQNPNKHLITNNMQACES